MIDAIKVLFMLTGASTYLGKSLVISNYFPILYIFCFVHKVTGKKPTDK